MGGDRSTQIIKYLSFRTSICQQYNKANEIIENWLI